MSIDQEDQARERAVLEQTIFNEAAVCVATVGLDKRFLTCNRAFCEFLGYSEDELRRKTIAEVTFPEDAALGMGDIRAVVAGEKRTSRVEKRYVRKDGAMVWGEVSINLVRDGEGQPMYLLPIIVDLTERKRIAAALEAETANLDAIFESSPVGMMILDATTNIVRANAAIVALSGGSRSDMLQHRPGNALRCIHSTKDPRGCGYAPSCPLCPARRGMEGLLANGGTISGAELPLQLVRNAEPEEVWLRIGAEPILMNGCRHLCVAMEDVTARKRVEEALRVLNAELEQRVAARTIELQASTKELEAFSYSVSHDLRAPLRAIDGFGLALLEDCDARLDADGKDHLQRIRAATLRMGNLIDDMLRLSRITRTELLLERIDLTELAGSVVDELKKSQPERLVTVKIADGLVANADRKLMRIALENLLGNAWKFTGKQSQATIEFGSTHDGGETAYFVRDNGAGFDMAYSDKLFSPFQRLHSVEEFPGTGIGLGTVQRVMGRHGGKAWAEGEVGKGATFYFRFAREPGGLRS